MNLWLLAHPTYLDALHSWFGIVISATLDTQYTKMCERLSKNQEHQHQRKRMCERFPRTQEQQHQKGKTSHSPPTPNDQSTATHLQHPHTQILPHIRSPLNGDKGYPFFIIIFFRRSDRAFTLFMGHKYRIYTFLFDIV